MSKKLLFNLNKNVSQDYTYVKYTGTIVTATNTLEKPIKNAILKGDTKYRDVDTGEILDSFDGTKNLELVSVKMPVLQTVGKNLFKGFTKYDYSIDDGVTIKEITDNSLKYIANGVWSASIVFYIPIIGGKNYIMSADMTNAVADDFYFVDELKQVVGAKFGINKSVTSPANAKFIKWHVRNGSVGADCLISNFQLEENSVTTSHEPYKTNILTVNEEVILRSNGDVYDELNVLTGKLIQRISEDGEVLSEEITKTVTLNIVDQDENEVSSISSFNDTTHIITSSETISPVFEGYIATKESVE